MEEFVERLAQPLPAARTAKKFPDELLHEINAEREALRREHGLFDTLPLIREFRETGGR